MSIVSTIAALQHAELALGTVRLLDDVTLGVPDGARIGVVGRNGGGKSTLLRVLAGVQPVDAGRVTRPGGQTIGLLTQHDTLPASATVRQVLFGSGPEHIWATDPRIRDLLSGLLGGVAAEGVGGMQTPVGTLSGGERRRVALAGLLADDPDLLLLDEPTNHLDIDGVAWLAGYLLARRTRSGSALVAITHDRWFLDAVATRTWEVVDGQIEAYEGGYAAYVLARAERERQAAASSERRANLLRKELAWLRRGAPARTSKPKFRLDAASALIADEPAPRDQVSLARFAATRLGKDVIDLEDATIRLGERAVLDRVTWRLAPGDRIGVLGANGTGKTTLVRALTGEVALSSGRRRVGKTVVVAHLSQEVTELEPLGEHRVVEAVAEVRSHIRMGDKEVSAAQLARLLGFDAARQQIRVSDLSGGERRRLQLLRLLMGEPNVLVLDEPTNDLDIDTLTAVEDVLDGWPGTLLVISHDRYLLERMCDRQVGLLGDGRVSDLPGGVEQFLQLRAAAVATDAVPGSQPAPAARAGVTSGGPNAADLREARKEITRIDRRLSRVAGQVTHLHEQMAARASDHQAVTELDAQLRALLSEQEELESAWLTVSEILE